MWLSWLCPVVLGEPAKPGLMSFPSPLYVLCISYCSIISTASEDTEERKRVWRGQCVVFISALTLLPNACVPVLV